MLRIEKNQLDKNRKGQLFRRFLAGIVAGVLAFQGASAVLPERVYAEPADASVRNWYTGSIIELPEKEPSWTAMVDNYQDMNDPYVGHQAVAEEGKVFTFAGAKLIAIDTRSGKRLWTYGKELTPYVVYQNGVIYGMTGDHKPYAINAKTGKAKWQSASSTWIDTRLRTEALVPTVDTLYVIKGSITFAFDSATGKLRWTADEPMAEGGGTAYLEDSGGVVLRTFPVQGALSSIQLDAFDKKTGKKVEATEELLVFWSSLKA